MEQHTWKRDLVAAIERAAHLTLNLLIGDWLRFDIALCASDPSMKNGQQLKDT
jgi:hypothetical protein